jgi:hypothetical protein
MNKKILDSAFELVKPAFNDISREEARKQLSINYSDVVKKDIDEAFTKACDLANACYNFADKCRDKIITEEEAIQMMAKQFPGFSQGTYKSALGYGYYLSR